MINYHLRLLMLVSISELRFLLLRGEVAIGRNCNRMMFQSQNWDSCYWELIWKLLLITNPILFQSQNWDSCYWERIGTQLQRIMRSGFNLRIEILVIERIVLLKQSSTKHQVSISELRFLLLRENTVVFNTIMVEIMFQSQNWDSCYWELIGQSSSLWWFVSRFNLRIEILVIERYDAHLRYWAESLGFNLRIEILVIESWITGTGVGIVRCRFNLRIEILVIERDDEREAQAQAFYRFNLRIEILVIESVVRSAWYQRNPDVSISELRFLLLRARFDNTRRRRRSLVSISELRFLLLRVFFRWHCCSRLL